MCLVLFVCVDIYTSVSLAWHNQQISKRVSFLSESTKTSPAKTPKKVKVEVYKLTQEQKALIRGDKPNKKLWDEAMGSLTLGPVSIIVWKVISFSKLLLMFVESVNEFLLYMGKAMKFNTSKPLQQHKKMEVML